jgi:hypothetical protein
MPTKTGGTPRELKGADFYNDTNAKTGSWWKIYVVSAATFTTLTHNLGGNTMTGVAFPAGTELIGLFTAITLTSGSVIAFRN